MGWIFVDKESEGDMRSQMRKNMRGGGYRNYGGRNMRSVDNYSDGYRQGYKHGWEDSKYDEDEEMEMRRRRDSQGRFV